MDLEFDLVSTTIATALIETPKDIMSTLPRISNSVILFSSAYNIGKAVKYIVDISACKKC